MRCPACGFTAIRERAERTTQGYRRFRCGNCSKQFNERSVGVLNRAQYPSDVIALVVLWRPALQAEPAGSGQDVPDPRVRLQLRSCTRLGEQVNTGTGGEPASATQRQVGRWYIDETYIRVRGQWRYLYRAIDRDGALVDVLLSGHRDLAAADAFFRSAKTVTNVTLDRITTDGHDAYPGAIRTELGKHLRHRISRYLNNRLEQDHRGINGRCRPMLGLKSTEPATRYCRGYDELRNFLRCRSRMRQHVPAAARRSPHMRKTAIVLAVLAPA